MLIEEVVPERRFAWRWHPHASDAAVDYSGEQRTLVTFTLEDAPDGGWRWQLQDRLPAYLVAA